MKDRLAFSTNAFSNENYTVDQAIHIIGECGYSGVEILFDKPHVWPLDLDASRVDELKTAVESSGMAISNINGNTASGFTGNVMPLQARPSGLDFLAPKKNLRNGG